MTINGAHNNKILTIIVPAYNIAQYVERCVCSIVAVDEPSDVEVLIVDDGSSDETAQVVDELEDKYTGVVRVVHQANKGHGGAVNTGIAQAKGMYCKVVDADDWVDTDSLNTVLETLRRQQHSYQPIDLLVTNYVYDKVGKKRKHVIRFKHAMFPNRMITWDDVRHFRVDEYLTMHSLIYRTQVLKESQLQLPEHTFYVDFIYSYQPLPWVQTLMYLDVPLYHYFIGRKGQSVERDAMIRRIPQLLKVHKLMALATPESNTVPQGLYRYMIHYLSINSVITSVFCILSNNHKNYWLKKQMWKELEEMSPSIARDVRSKIASRAINLPGKLGRFMVRKGYTVVDKIIGFN